jgi:solute carrier family 35 protein F1/2
MQKSATEIGIESAVGTPTSQQASSPPLATESALTTARRELFAYIKTPRFYLVLFIGQILSLCITGTNTFSILLAGRGTSIPAFQSFFNYVLLNIVYTSYTLHVYGLRGYWELLKRRGWKYLILAFLDVEGNYFVVLAYRYTAITSATLINFWAIVVVVAISFAFLKVRYHWTQISGIVLCVGGMGLLLARDAVTGRSTPGSVSTELKGDLFMLLGATLYGFTNVAEEFLVSKAPLYEVVGQIGFWGMLINGAQAGIFDRQSFRRATWDGKVGGYLTGFTLLMFIFYTVVPILLRLASAAFFNISLLTVNFYSVAIGIKLFGQVLDRFYPLAFVMVVLGLLVYFMFISVYGESKKPWLGERQEKGVVGVGTAKRVADEEAGEGR